MPKNKDFIYVILQVILLGVYLLEIPALIFEPIGFVSGFFAGVGFVGVLLILVALIQLNTKISPFPTPRNGSQLITNGAFQFTRHPIYTGIFITLFCYGLVVGSGFKTALSIVLIVLFYYKSAYEEQLLLQQFPEYKNFQSSVGQLFPYIGIKK
jgi:protein-S-isoprenylcysteine O-methyltransferase Ste14